jgi:uncharacterized protein YgiM (DUF1202 family)
MSKLVITFFLLLIHISTYADSFCGVVLAENGLNIRTEPNLKSDIIYKLHKGETFKLYSDGYTGIFQTIKDGNDRLKGQWIKIDLYNFDKESNPEEGYIFLTPKYAVEMYDCREFRHRILENELYNSTNTENEYSLKRKDTLKTILELEYFNLKAKQKPLNKDIYNKNKNDYKVSKDTLSLKLENGKLKKIISYPFGKNGNEDSREEYTYIGYLKRLNSYLIRGSYWESGDYFFVSKKTGLISDNFYGSPKISPNNKLMLIIDEDAYEEGTNIALFEIKNNNVKLKINYSFSDWVIDGEAFWISNSEIVIPARSIKDENNWIDKDYNNDIDAEKIWKKVKKKYVKIKIL